jgi:acetyl esterase/lipase
MRTIDTDYQDGKLSPKLSNSWGRQRLQGGLVCAVVVTLLAGCGNSNSGGSSSGGSGSGSGGLAAGGATSTANGTGGTSLVASSTGGASVGGTSSVPSGTGGTTQLSGGTGGATSVAGGTGGVTSVTGGTTATTGKTGGTTAVSSSAGGAAGGAQVSGGSTSQSGGNAATGGTSKNTGGSVSGGNSGSTGGSGSGGTTSTGGVLPPPVRDTASKVPISSPPSGYTVEGNYPYGPLTAQRIDILYPTGGGPKATQVLPVVVMFHGGAWIHSYTNNYGSGKDHMSTFFDRFLAHGFIVCNAEYRVNDGTVDGAPAPAAVQDALLAAKWCWDYMDYFHGDRTKYVVTGASAGGHLALMVGMTTPAAALGPTSPTDYTIAGIVDGYGPADIEAEINAVAAGWLPTSLPNRLAIAKEVNPMTYVRKDVPPLIVVQGSNDNTAPIADSLKLVANLQAAGDTDVTMHEVAGAGHGFTTPATAWPDAEKAMFDWLTAKGMGK